MLSLLQRCNFLRNYQVLLLFEPRPSSQRRALQGFYLVSPIGDLIHHWQMLPGFVPSLSTVKTEKQLVSMGMALVLWLPSDFAFTVLACQTGCLSKRALTETTLSALCQAPRFWSLQPSEISPVTDEKGKLRNWLSQGPKSLNIWTKIQIQICLLNISPLCQSTIFF